MDPTTSPATPVPGVSPGLSPTPLTAHLAHQSHAPSGTPAGAAGLHLGREKINWSPEVWARIDHAVQHEVHRTRVAAKFLPHHEVDPHITTVPADTVLSSIGGSPMGVVTQLPGGATPLLNIDEGATTRLIETWVEFSMTPQQVEQENKMHAGQAAQHAQPADHSHGGHPSQHKPRGYSTAVTLASRAANTLTEAEDTVIFQGQNAFPAGAIVGSPLFSSGFVLNRGTPSDYGLLSMNAANPLPLPPIPVQPITVTPAPVPPLARYSENTVAAINDAYSVLQAGGHYGPYACVLYFYAYADAYSPLPTTLILPADRINPLMTEGFFGTGTMPGIPNPQNPIAKGGTEPQLVGLVVSIGGNTMDFVIGQHPITAYMQQDPNGNFRFRVFERFCLRLKDATAVVRLEFQ